MKKIIRLVALFFCFSFFSSIAVAQEPPLVLAGKGGTVDAVKAFNRAVAFNGGTVDGNSTDFSSAGDFGEYVAKMVSEADKRNVVIHITFATKNPDFLQGLLGIEKNDQSLISTRIEESMKKYGYHK